MATRLHVEIDRGRCMGSGNCAYWSPATFDVGEDGIAVVVGDPAVDADRVRLAAAECPTRSIALREEAR